MLLVEFWLNFKAEHVIESPPPLAKGAEPSPDAIRRNRVQLFFIRPEFDLYVLIVSLDPPFAKSNNACSVWNGKFSASCISIA